MLEVDALLPGLDGIAHGLLVEGAQQEVAHVAEVGTRLLHDGEQLARREQQGMGLTALHVLEHGGHGDVVGHDMAARQGYLYHLFGEHGMLDVAIGDIAVLAHALALDALCLDLPLGT